VERSCKTDESAWLNFVAEKLLAIRQILRHRMPYEANFYLVRAKILVVMNRPADAIEVVNSFERPWGLMYFYALARRYDDAIQDG
jgi:hypothetical protein